MHGECVCVCRYRHILVLVEGDMGCWEHCQVNTAVGLDAVAAGSRRITCVCQLSSG